MIAGNDDAFNDRKGVVPFVGFFPSLMRFKGGKNCALNLCRRDTSDRSGFGFSSSQQRRAYVETIAHAVFAGKARTHAVAAVVIEFAHKKRLARGTTGLSAGGFRCEKPLDLIEGLGFDNSRVLAGEPFVLVTGLANVNPIFEEMGERAIGEGNPPIELL